MNYYSMISTEGLLPYLEPYIEVVRTPVPLALGRLKT